MNPMTLTTNNGIVVKACKKNLGHTWDIVRQQHHIQSVFQNMLKSTEHNIMSVLQVP